MLYQLSYASKGDNRPSGRIYPSDPFHMSGTIVKGTIATVRVQTANLRECYDDAVSSIPAGWPAALPCEYDEAFLSS